MKTISSVLTIFLFSAQGHAIDLYKLNEKRNAFIRQFTQHKNIFEKCSDRSVSQNNEPETEEFGCLDTYEFFKKICDKRLTVNYEYRNPEISARHFSDSCEFVERSNQLMLSFIDQDAKSCRKGFENLPTRLKSISEKEHSLPEGVPFRYELLSCKQIKTYVNLCAYIDGQLRANNNPNINELLPNTNLAQSKLITCSEDEKLLSSFYNFNQEIKKRSLNIEKPVLKDLISHYRNRTPAGTKNSDCEGVRSVFVNLRCFRYENISEADPLYYSQEDMTKMRMESQQRVKDMNSGKINIWKSNGTDNTNN